jgi:hypothetical protein
VNPTTAQKIPNPRAVEAMEAVEPSCDIEIAFYVNPRIGEPW